MKPLLSLLMIASLLVGNSLAHLHGACVSGLSVQARPHFHIGSGADHHHHPHLHSIHRHPHHPRGGHVKPFESTADVPTEHDSDAIYLVHADFTNTSANHNSVRVAVDCQLEAATSYSLVAQRIAQREGRRSLVNSGLPLYLKWAALRL